MEKKPFPLSPEDGRRQVEAKVGQLTGQVAAKLDQVAELAAQMDAKAESRLLQQVEKSKEVLGQDLESKAEIADAMLRH